MAQEKRNDEKNTHPMTDEKQEHQANDVPAIDWAAYHANSPKLSIKGKKK